MTKAIRRLVLEQFGGIDVELELDLNLSPDQMYEKATKIERALDAYKSAFWDSMKAKKAARLGKQAEKDKLGELEKADKMKAEIATLIENEPDVVKAKVTEFNGLIDEKSAAALIIKERTTPAKPEAKDAPAFPDTMTFFKTKYGWALYTDPDKQDSILAWLISIPKEERGRKTADPKKSNNGKAIYCNDKEKALVETEAKNQNKRVNVKEDSA